MKNNIKSKAKLFLRKYRLKDVTLNDLRRIIKSQGYTIVEFNHIFNDENVSRLIESLGVEGMISKSKGFTYADGQWRLVFVHEDLSDEEKRVVLAHEEGHIFCGHLTSEHILGKDVTQEYEANEFTHYILNVGAGRKFTNMLSRNKLAICIASALIVTVVVGLTVFKVIQKERSYYGKYYLSATGSKYHKEQCIFVQDKTNIRRMTIEEYKSGDYEPCDMCLPHETK